MPNAKKKTATKPRTSVSTLGQDLAKRLRENADECRRDAAKNLHAAAEAIREGQDDDIVDGLLLDAQWDRGEARGHLNAAHDVLEELGLPT